MSGRVFVIFKKLHDGNKNMSQALHKAALSHAGKPAARHHLQGCPGRAVGVSSQSCLCPVVELEKGSKGDAQKAIKQRVSTCVRKNALDFGLRGCEWRKVVASHRDVHGPNVTEFTLQMFELHALFLSLCARTILS